MRLQITGKIDLEPSFKNHWKKMFGIFKSISILLWSKISKCWKYAFDSLMQSLEHSWLYKHCVDKYILESLNPEFYKVNQRHSIKRSANQATTIILTILIWNHLKFGLSSFFTFLSGPSSPPQKLQAQAICRWDFMHFLNLEYCH